MDTQLKRFLFVMTGFITVGSFFLGFSTHLNVIDGLKTIIGVWLMVIGVSITVAILYWLAIKLFK